MLPPERPRREDTGSWGGWCLLVAAVPLAPVLPEPGHAVTHQQPPSWQGGSPCAVLGGWRGGSAGDGLFLPLRAALATGRSHKLLSFQTGQLEPLLSRFTEEEDLQMKRMLQRMDVLAKVGDTGAGGAGHGCCQRRGDT